jgi:hypothetical protein
VRPASSPCRTKSHFRVHGRDEVMRCIDPPNDSNAQVAED